MPLSAKDALKKFNVELLEELPLENPIFFGKARRADLFPLGTADSIQAKPTRAEKVALFLQCVVEPGADDYLPKLLKVMKRSKIKNVVKLAGKIEAAMKPAKASTASKRKRKRSDSSDDKAIRSPRARKRRKVSDSEDDDVDDEFDDDKPTTSKRRRKGDEEVHSLTDGKSYFDFKELEKAKNAVCILRNMGANGPKDVGTGFVGRDVETKSAVLVTCYHVIIDGLPEDGMRRYHNANYKDLNEARRKVIEENAKKFTIKIRYQQNDKEHEKSIKLKDLLKSGTSKLSPNSSVC